MATSGSTDFTLTRDDIIKESLEIIDSLATGASVPSADTTSVSRTFNMFIKALQTDGAELWTRSVIQQTLSASSVVSQSGSNYTSVLSHTSAADNQPGIGANWTTYWEITTDTAGGAWALSTAYNFIGDFTLDGQYIGVDQVFIREETNGKTYDYPAKIEPFGAYLDLVDKISTSGGVPTSVFLDEGLSAISGYMYPIPTTSMVLHLMAIRTIEDLDSATDNPDFPVRWFETLSLGLAVRLAPKYGVWGDKLAQLSSMYENALSKAKKDGKESLALFMAPTYVTQ